MLAPGGVEAWIGRTLSQIPNTRITTIPDTTSGMTVAERPTTLIVRSMRLPTFSADNTPPAMPSGTTTTNARAASLSELTSALPRMGPIGTCWAYDVPRLPVSTFPIQVRYCEISDLSVPSLWASSFTEDCWANGPRMARAGSPGSTWAAKKTMMLRIHSVISPRPIRLRMNLVIACRLAPRLRRLVGVLEVDRGDRGGVDPVHLG